MRISIVPLVVILLWLPPVVFTNCSLAKDECEATDIHKDDVFEILIQYRVEIVDGAGSPVEGATVRVTHYKIHCSGSQSSHDVDEGTTAASGIFSNELQTVKRSYTVSNWEDTVVMQLAIHKGGWIHEETRIYNASEIDNLLDNVYEDRIRQHWVATYDGS